MSEPFIGEIRVFAFSYAPVGWAFCNGSQISPQQNPALFSLLGVNFGGDGKSSFYLPNLQSRLPMGYSPGSGTHIGIVSGTETATITTSSMANHSHVVNGEIQGVLANMLPSPGNNALPNGVLVGTTLKKAFSSLTTPNVNMSPSMVLPTGGGVAHENRQPFLAMNFCIALDGIYPYFPN